MVYNVIHDDRVAMGNDRPLQEKRKSLQGTFVFIAFGLTHRKRNWFANRWIDNRRVGIHHMHVRQNMTPIDEKSGRRPVPGRCVVAGSRFSDDEGPYGADGIQKRIIFMVRVVPRMQSIFGYSTIFLQDPVRAPDPGTAAFRDGACQDKTRKPQRN